MWTVVFAGGLYVVIRGIGLLVVRNQAPGWFSALIVLAGLMAMGTAVLFIGATTTAFLDWIAGRR